MEAHVDPDERTPGDYLLFICGFIGFLVGVGGVIAASPLAAFMGAVILLLAVLSFRLFPSRND